jgi:imidazolonepropionase-like amidohydrolase
MFRGRIVIEAGKISEITSPNKPMPFGERLYDYGDHILFPGLIDTHCHLCLPGDGTTVEGYLSTNSCAAMVKIGCTNAQRALAAGITTLRDLGSPHDLAFEVRRHLELLEIEHPRILVSGAPLTVPGGHLSSFGRCLEGMTDIENHIQELATRGADVIKVIGSGSGGPDQSFGLPFSKDLLEVIVRQAHQVNLPATAHVTTPAAIEACLDAGFDGLEHLGFWGHDGLIEFRDDLVSRVRDQGVFVAPTIQAIYRTWRELVGQKEVDQKRREKIYRETVEVFVRLLKYNLRFVSGSDAGWLLNPFGDLALGLKLMVRAGMTASAALQTATTTAAAALWMEGHIGCLSPGAEADIIVLPGNPLESIDVLRQVEEVFIAGQRVKR